MPWSVCPVPELRIALVHAVRSAAAAREGQEHETKRPANRQIRRSSKAQAIGSAANSGRRRAVHDPDRRGRAGCRLNTKQVEGRIGHCAHRGHDPCDRAIEHVQHALFP